MKKFLIPALLALGVAAGGLAVALPSIADTEAVAGAARPVPNGAGKGTGQQDVAQEAVAGGVVTGAIHAIDARTMSITLDNGHSYQLPIGFRTDSLQVGEKVAVKWRPKDRVNAALSVDQAVDQPGGAVAGSTSD